ncbi:MAG: AP2 domain-containing protein [Bacillota bacterium]|nr:AP2 domain-containing protein [Bacillota bacterium]
MAKVIDITGNKYGRLTVIKRAENSVSPNGCVFAKWECRCDCGNVVTVKGYLLRSGNTKSCGCSRKETLRNLMSTHGKSKTRLYQIWCGMKKRCNNPSSSIYKHYGGRGIKVCKEWEDNFEAFYEWASRNGYADYLSIDRINVNLGYSPENCKWATEKEQKNNMRSNHKIKYMGMDKTLSEWGEYLGESPRRISWRINHGWRELDALLGIKACAGEIATEGGKTCINPNGSVT